MCDCVWFDSCTLICTLVASATRQDMEPMQHAQGAGLPSVLTQDGVTPPASPRNSHSRLATLPDVWPRLPGLAAPHPVRFGSGVPPAAACPSTGHRTVGSVWGAPQPISDRHSVLLGQHQAPDVSGPEGLTAETGSECAGSVLRHFPVFTSHILTLSSN